MPTEIAPFLVFQGGVAEQATTSCTSLSDDGEVLDVSRSGPGEPGPEGTLQVARFSLAGREHRCSDGPVAHDVDVTPSSSRWVETASEDELERLFTTLADGGRQLVPLGDHGVRRRFGWVGDRFGVSWQLNLAAAEG